MSHNRSITSRVRFLVVIFLTIGRVLRADDASSTDDNGKVVQLPSGAKLKVQDADPYKNLHVPPPTGQYDPTKYSMNQTSSFANKQFSADSIAVSKNGSSLVHNQEAYTTKAYTDLSPANPTAQNYDAKYSTSAANESDHGDADAQFSKNYTTSSSSLGHDAASSFSSTSSDQNRTATLGSKTSKTFASEISKQYLGPGAQHVPDGFVKENVVMATVKDIPNRPLTIDEVRSLINHGIKPDLDTAPSESSKPLKVKPEAME